MSRLSPRLPMRRPSSGRPPSCSRPKFPTSFRHETDMTYGGHDVPPRPHTSFDHYPSTQDQDWLFGDPGMQHNELGCSYGGTVVDETYRKGESAPRITAWATIPEEMEGDDPAPLKLVKKYGYGYRSEWIIYYFTRVIFVYISDSPISDSSALPLLKTLLFKVVWL